MDDDGCPQHLTYLVPGRDLQPPRARREVEVRVEVTGSLLEDRERDWAAAAVDRDLHPAGDRDLAALRVKERCVNPVEPRKSRIEIELKPSVLRDVDVVQGRQPRRRNGPYDTPRHGRPDGGRQREEARKGDKADHDRGSFTRSRPF